MRSGEPSRDCLEEKIPLIVELDMVILPRAKIRRRTRAERDGMNK